MAERTPRFLPSPGSLWSNRTWLRWLVRDAQTGAEDPAAALDLIRAEVAKAAPANLDLVPHLTPDTPTPRHAPQPLPWRLLFDPVGADG